MAAIPSTTGKTGAEALSGIPLRAWEGGRLHPEAASRYSFEAGGQRFDLLWHPRPEARRLFVLFSGAADRRKMSPPVFQRWTWAPQFPGHCLFVSDPSLHLDPRLALAWYAGTAAFDPQPVLLDVLAAACGPLGLGEADVVSYGSSGGGFAALRLVAAAPAMAAVAINPQTDVTAYSVRGRVRRFLDICFGGLAPAQARAAHGGRLVLTGHADRLARARIVYLQNTEDPAHLEGHMRPLCDAMGLPVEAGDAAGRFRRILFAREGGHRRAESPEVFARAMAILDEEAFRPDGR